MIVDAEDLSLSDAVEGGNNNDDERPLFGKFSHNNACLTPPAPNLEREGYLDLHSTTFAFWSRSAFTLSLGVTKFLARAVVKAIFGTNELFSLSLSFLRSYSRNPDPNYEEKSRSAAAAARIKFPHAQRKRRRRRLRLPTPKLKCPLWSNRTRGISTTVDGRNSDVVTAKWEEERLEWPTTDDDRNRTGGNPLKD